MHSHPVEVVLFGWDITYYRPWVQLGICIIGTFSFHIFHGIALERLFREDGFVYGWFLTFIQFATYAMMAVLNKKLFPSTYRTETHFFEGPTKEMPAKWFYYITVAMVTTVGLSNYSLNFVTYPAQQLIKSGKLIPVMVGGRIMLQKQYTTLEYLSAIFIAFGLSVIALEKMSMAPSETEDESILAGIGKFIGIIMLLTALVADAFVGNLQEKVLKEFSIREETLIYRCYKIGSGCLLAILIISGELTPAIVYCYNSVAACVWLFIFGVTGYMGLIFVFALIRLFGAFVAVTVTSTRKVVSISLSFFIFPKTISIWFGFAAVMVFSGLGLHIYSKNRNKINALLGIGKPRLVTSTRYDYKMSNSQNLLRHSVAYSEQTIK